MKERERSAEDGDGGGDGGMRGGALLVGAFAFAVGAFAGGAALCNAARCTAMRFGAVATLAAGAFAVGAFAVGAFTGGLPGKRPNCCMSDRVSTSRSGQRDSRAFMRALSRAPTVDLPESVLPAGEPGTP